MQTHHELKIEESYYHPVIAGDKPFEIRFNDRGYQKGDRITFTPILKNGTRNHSLKKVDAEITYVTGYSQKPDWVVFGIKLTSNWVL